jgi:hypothetical protein
MKNVIPRKFFLLFYVIPRKFKTSIYVIPRKFDEFAIKEYPSNFKSLKCRDV